MCSFCFLLLKITSPTAQPCDALQNLGYSAQLSHLTTVTKAPDKMMPETELLRLEKTGCSLHKNQPISFSKDSWPQLSIFAFKNP